MGQIEQGMGNYFRAVQAVLLEPIRARGLRRERVEAAARAAVDFHVWRALAPLGDSEAAELTARLVELAGQEQVSPTHRRSASR